jgi:hypothetical protein
MLGGMPLMQRITIRRVDLRRQDVQMGPRVLVFRVGSVRVDPGRRATERVSEDERERQDHHEQTAHRPRHASSLSPPPHA